MNVYYTVVESEHGRDAYYIPASSPRTAVGRTLQGTKHARANNVSVSCQLFAKKISSWEEWKKENLDEVK